MKAFKIKNIEFVANGTAIVRNGKEIELVPFSVNIDSKSAREIKKVVCANIDNVRAADVVIEKVERVENVMIYKFDVDARDIINALIGAGYEYTIA